MDMNMKVKIVVVEDGRYGYKVVEVIHPNEVEVSEVEFIENNISWLTEDLARNFAMKHRMGVI
jgi:hypothetical protein